jgi:hypothetical protein
VDFHVVYIREAHVTDVWQDPDNVEDNVIFASPKDYTERVAMGQLCLTKLAIKMPAIVDGFDNSVEHTYTAWPDRMYLLDRDGKVVFKSLPGPFGFRTRYLTAALSQLVPDSSTENK